jgi:hypothetical protein
MKKFIMTITALVAFSVGVTTQAQTPAPTLATSIKKLESIVVKRITAEDTQGWSYVVDTSSFRELDFNHDGRKDAVVIVTLCEKESCDITSQVATAFVLRNNGRGYDVTNQVEVGMNPKIVSVGAAGAVVQSSKMGRDDPMCCPTGVRFDKVVFVKN